MGEIIMTIEQHKKATALIEKINALKSNIHRMEHACSNHFAIREMTINILNSNQPEGFAFIPKGIVKEVCKIILNQSVVELQQLEKELEQL